MIHLRIVDDQSDTEERWEDPVLRVWKIQTHEDQLCFEKGRDTAFKSRDKTIRSENFE
jgi:hypothetical protein